MEWVVKIHFGPGASIEPKIRHHILIHISLRLPKKDPKLNATNLIGSIGSEYDRKGVFY